MWTALLKTEVPRQHVDADTGCLSVSGRARSGSRTTNRRRRRPPRRPLGPAWVLPATIDRKRLPGSVLTELGRQKYVGARKFVERAEAPERDATQQCVLDRGFSPARERGTIAE